MTIDIVVDMLPTAPYFINEGLFTLCSKERVNGATLCMVPVCMLLHALTPLYSLKLRIIEY